MHWTQVSFCRLIESDWVLLRVIGKCWNNLLVCLSRVKRLMCAVFEVLRSKVAVNWQLCPGSHPTFLMSTNSEKKDGFNQKFAFVMSLATVQMIFDSKDGYTCEHWIRPLLVKGWFTSLLVTLEFTDWKHYDSHTILLLQHILYVLFRRLPFLYIWKSI